MSAIESRKLRKLIKHYKQCHNLFIQSSLNIFENTYGRSAYQIYRVNGLAMGMRISDEDQVLLQECQHLSRYYKKWVILATRLQTQGYTVDYNCK